MSSLCLLRPSGRSLRGLVAAALLTLPACGGSDFHKVYPVTGKILVNGQPAGDCLIYLNRTFDDDHPRRVTPYALTNENGEFQITSYITNDGAPEGEYVVTIEWRDRVGMSQALDGPDQLGGAYAKADKTKALKGFVVQVGKQPLELPPFTRAARGIRAAWRAVPEPDQPVIRRRVRIAAKTPSLRGATWTSTGNTEQAIVRQLVAEGLHVGQRLRIIESTPDRIVLTDGENEYRLAPAVAANVFLAATNESLAHHGVVRLSDLGKDDRAEVIGLDEACQGFSRRRLMDLGFTEGARVRPMLQTFAGDPRAYEVRGTLVALRREQASQVLVRQEALA